MTKAPRVSAKPFGGAAPNFIKIGASRFDWRDPYHAALTLSWGTFTGVALAGLLLINALFAFLYLAEPSAVQNLHPGDYFMAFCFSLETLSTVGYGEMAPDGIYGHAVAATEIVFGMAFTAVMTGLVFIRFSRPRARFLFANNLVITSHNGRLMLMFRVANGRMTTMTSARVTLGVVLKEVTQEGRNFQGMHELKLVRSEIPLFPMAWTVMHVIDAASPLHGLSPEHLKETEARFFVGVEGRDTALQATVQDIRVFMHTDIAYGMRYADMISFNEAGQPVADLSMISVLEPQ